jgi:hypothetical protein
MDAREVAGMGQISMLFLLECHKLSYDLMGFLPALSRLCQRARVSGIGSAE